MFNETTLYYNTKLLVINFQDIFNDDCFFVQEIF